MLYSEMIANNAEIHSKRIREFCGQEVEFFNVIPVGI
jgi:hypothetical protein